MSFVCPISFEDEIVPFWGRARGVSEIHPILEGLFLFPLNFWLCQDCSSLTAVESLDLPNEFVQHTQLIAVHFPSYQ